MRPRPPGHTVGSWRARQSLPLVYPQRDGERGRRQGPEKKRDRLRLERRHRRRLDRAGLQPRRDARLRRRRGGDEVAGDPADQLRPDVPGRGRLLLHEQSRPGLRHQLLLGDQGDGPAARLDGGLGDRRRRRAGDGEPGADRRPLHVRALRLARGRRIDRRRHPRRGRLDHLDDLDRAAGDRALRPHPDRPARGGDLHPRPLLDRRLGQGLLGQRPDRLDPSLLLLDQPVLAERQRNLRRDAARRSSSTGAGTRPRR